MVEFGRRRAVGVVLAEAAEPEMEAKPLLARVRSRRAAAGCAVAAAGACTSSEHYLAPPGMVVRAMLPPGMLERIELFAVPGDSPDGLPRCEAALAGRPMRAGGERRHPRG